ncbi:MAG: DNA repair protein RecN [Nitrospiraceae bacterium]|nr:DNA repair protein RecN [Nitrospiraceae bacterium]
MLKELRIRNLAIIDDLSVRFEKGLNALTGETGAGKSIIVDALGLALGERAQSDFIRSGEAEASVQAYFELEDYSLLPDIGIDPSGGIALRRMLSAGGKSRAYVNDVMVTLQALSSIGSALVDILSQHEHQSLLAPDRQRDLVDSFGKLHREREQVEAFSRETGELAARCATLRETAREREQRLDFLRFQAQEIDAAGLKEGEKGALEEERRILANLTKLTGLTAESYAVLYESEGSCSEKLAQVISRLRDICAIDGGMEDTLRLLEAALPLVEDASLALGRYRDKFDFEPGRLETIEDRLDVIKKLERKYGEDASAVLAHRDAVQKELDEIESADETLAGAEAALEAKRAALVKEALELSAKRSKAAGKIEKLVAASLADLAFGSARFEIAVSRQKDADGNYRIGPTGLDSVEFLFSANPGEPPKALAKIISGGELSRVMLVLKTILADVDNTPVLVFDEADAGIGGKTAESVAKKLGTISKRRQLLCITHLPRIASMADFHLRIEKKEKDGKVSVRIKELSARERQDEIARMLSGTVTEISRRHAGELLERVK